MTDDDQQTLEEFRDTLDPSTFAAEPFVKRVEKPWGYELIWTPEGLPYVGKLIHITVGKQLSLQVHDKKQESWIKLSGDAMVVIENSAKELVTITLEDGQGYTVALGQKHRLKAGTTDCEIIEVSTPEIGNTYRLEDDYNRPTETEELRNLPDRGW